jgi:dTDP-4-dehydrorhamnose 3,5-epimerase
LNFIETPLPGVILIEPTLFSDDRGSFMETYHAERFAAAGITATFVQDNQSRSRRGVLRGLHYQEPRPQGKLVRCTRGALFDVAVDVRRGSPHFAKWYATELTEENRRMLWVPPGFAHGFCATSDVADLSYKCTDVYRPELDRAILWNDPEMAIDWPVPNPILSPRDAAAPRLRDAVLPAY